MRATRPTIYRLVQNRGGGLPSPGAVAPPSPKGRGPFTKNRSLFSRIGGNLHPAWVFGGLISVYRTHLVCDRPYNLKFPISITSQPKPVRVPRRVMLRPALQLHT